MIYCMASGPCSVVILIIDLCNVMVYYNILVLVLCVCVISRNMCLLSSVGY